MNWILIGLLAPAFRSVTNYIDKYLLSKLFKGESSIALLLIFSSIIGFIVLPFFYFMDPNITNISSFQKIALIIGGMLYLIAMIPMYIALDEEDASIVIPLYQMIPVLSLILGYIFLNESINQIQMLGFILVIGASLILSIDLEKGMQFKAKIFGLMFLSSLGVALNYLIFKMVAIDTNFWITGFWEYIGFIILSLGLLLIPKYQKSFFKVWEKNKMTVLSLNMLNEILNIIAKIVLNYVSLLTLLTFSWLINGLQPFFVFLYGMILTLLFPHIIKEKFNKKIAIQKLSCFSIIVVGILLL